MTWSSDAPADTDLYTFSAGAAFSDLGFAFNNAPWGAVPSSGPGSVTCTFRADGPGVVHLLVDDALLGLLDRPFAGRVGAGTFGGLASYGGLAGLGADNEVEDGTGSVLRAGSSPAYPALITNRKGQFAGVAFTTASGSAVGAGMWVAERPLAGPLEAQLLDSGRSGEYLEPAGVAYRRRLWVVYVAEAAANADGNQVGNIYLITRDEAGTWGTPIQVNDGDAVCSFPSIALSGEDDANGDGPVLVVAWREDPTTSRSDIYARVVTVADLDGAGDFVEASSVVSDRSLYDRSRDPCVWCTASGLFFIGYSITDTSTGSPTAQVGVQTNASPADPASAWTALTLINYTAGQRQDFIFGCANEADGRSVVVWEYGDSGLATIYGASCELSDPTTWTVLGDRRDYPGSGISDEPEKAYAQVPSCTLSDAGEVGLFFVRTDSAAPVVRYRSGTLA